MWALEGLANFVPYAVVPLLVLMPTADESSGGRLGMGHLVRTLRDFRADMAIVGEPTGGDVCLAHRGAVWAEIVVVGKSGQASRPASGTNAIMAMGRVLRALETDLAPRLAGNAHPLLPAPNLNAGLIDGGVKANVIAERCRVVVGPQRHGAEEQAHLVRPESPRHRPGFELDFDRLPELKLVYLLVCDDANVADVE